MAAQEVTIGVDFGTTNSVVAAVTDAGVEVLANDSGKRSTPSCVGVKDSKWKVGESALSWLTRLPTNIVQSVKSVLGHTLNTIDERHRQGAVTLASSARENVVVEIDGERTVAVEEIAAVVLRKLKTTATTQLKGEVKKAVIAVPSYFRASQRRAILDAAYLAGLEAVELVNETTAAAAAYAHGLKGTKIVVVVDIGGGGSSASIVKVQCNTVEVLAHSGTRLPGGEDFDYKMVEYLKERVLDVLNVEVDDPRDRESLLSHWKHVKETLSLVPRVGMTALLPSRNAYFSHELKWTDFEEQCGEMFREIADGVGALLDGAEVPSDMVDEVLLVGGSSRITHLRALVNRVMDQGFSADAYNPDEIVAEGAALLAAKCVVVEKEVLALRTEVSINGDVIVLRPNSVLPFYQDVPRNSKCQSSSVEVLQDASKGLMLPVLSNAKVNDLASVEITESGVLRIVKRVEEKCSLQGCLAPSNLETYRKRLEMALEESSRLVSQFALQKLLRVELSRDLSTSDRLCADIMELRRECVELVDWVNDHTDEPAKKYDELRSEIEEKIAILRGKLEYESSREEAEECLREVLLVTAVAEVPDDSLYHQEMRLRDLCSFMLHDLEKDTRPSEAKLQKYLEHILTAKDNLEVARTQYEAEMLRHEAICKARKTCKKPRDAALSEFDDSGAGDSSLSDSSDL